jgi:hypothetical protein
MTKSNPWIKGRKGLGALPQTAAMHLAQQFDSQPYEPVGILLPYEVLNVQGSPHVLKINGSE